MKNYPYGRQWITKNDVQAVTDVLMSDYLTQGPVIDRFEKVLAKFVGAKYAVVLNSGTAALHAAYFASGLKQSDEFITSPITFAATANAGLYMGAKPVFADIEAETGNINISKIEKNITPKTKLIVPVHYAGFPVDLKPLRNLAQKHHLKIIEDACHALGARYEDENIGSCQYSDMAVFSFHPVKHITTGEGGAVTTNNRDLYEKMLMFRTHGITKDKNKLTVKNEGEWYHEMQFLGFNYRLTDFQAALGLSQLAKLKLFIKNRRKIASSYNQAFKINPFFDIIEEKKNAFSGYHLYSILLKKPFQHKKKGVFCLMREKGLGVQVHYIPVYNHPYYQSLGYKKGLCPEAEGFYQSEISIPIYPLMDKRDTATVISLIFSIFNSLK